MKKIIVFALALLFSVSAFAQEYKQSVGLRLGYDFSLTYTNHLDAKHFIDAGIDLGVFHPHRFDLMAYGFFNWRWDFGNVKGLSWHTGPGLFLGPVFYGGYGTGTSTKFWMSINAAIGLEYKFENAPIALTADYYPGMTLSPQFDFSYQHGGIGVKFTF